MGNQVEIDGDERIVIVEDIYEEVDYVMDWYINNYTYIFFFSSFSKSLSTAALRFGASSGMLWAFSN